MPAGRPKKEIDEEQIRKLAAMFCTTEEIASFFEVDRRTIERNYAAVMIDGRNVGKMSIKRKQYEVAMEGNPLMLKWVGIQYLEQRDKRDINISELPDDLLAKEASRRLNDSGTKSST